MWRSLAGQVIVIPKNEKYSKLQNISSLVPIVMLILRVIRSGNGGKRGRSSPRLFHTEKFLEAQLKCLGKGFF